MEAIDVVGLILPALEQIGSRVIGFDEKIRKRFNRALEKALPNDEFYIRNAKIHITELVGLIVLVMDEPSSINTISIPKYISRDEFRRFYEQTKEDEELWRVLQEEWNQYKAKDTNSIVKAISNKIDKLSDNKEEDRAAYEEIKAAINKLIERLDEKEGNKGSNGNEDVVPLCDYLKEILENKRREHPSFRLKEIDDNLFPNGMITFESEALDADNKRKNVKDIIADSWQREERHHLMIEGRGGIGKTITLLSIPDPAKFAPRLVPAIYIPLHEVKGDYNTIEKYIKNEVLDQNDKEERYTQLLDAAKKPWDNGPNLLLLLDGFNEIANEQRGEISEDIERWSKRPGVQIITSSRYDIHQYVALSSTFSKIELQPISEKKVKEYLKKNESKVPKNPDIIKLITIPLLLKLYITTERYRKTCKSRFANYRETNNAGLLIWNYLQCELWRYRTNEEESKACVLAMEFIAPYIAWTMQQHSEFVLREEDFLGRLEKAYKLLETHFGNLEELPKHIKATVQKTSRQLPQYSVIRNLLQESLCLFNRQERKDSNNEDITEYRLMHQQFRDALAAMHLINLSYQSGNSLPQEWNTPIDYYVIQFVVDLISKNEANLLWEQNRKTQPTIENATRNQLRLQGSLHDNDFSELDFSDIDLSNISLYPYRYSQTILKLPTQQAKMVKTKISKKTISSEGHVESVCSVTVTPDGKRIVSGSRDCTIRIWDLETGAPIGSPIEGHKRSVNAVAVTPDGKRVISGSNDNTIRVWDLETGLPIGSPIEGHKDSVNTVAVTPDGKRIVSGSDDLTIRVWDLETGLPIGSPIEGHKDSVNAVAVTLNGKRIVSGSDDRTIRVWDLETGAQIGSPVEGHEFSVNTVAVTPDGKCIVSGSDDNTIRVWDLETGAPIGSPIEGHEDRVNAVTVTPNGKRIVSGSYDRTIRVWDLETGIPIGVPLEGHKRWVNAVAVTPDGKRIVSGFYDNTIRVWDMETSAPIGSPIEGYKDRVNAVAVTPDGKRIVSGSDDNTIRVWDLETDEPIGSPFEGHISWVNAVAVTPDGRRIVSGSYDNTIRVWDLETGEPIGNPIKGHKRSVNAVAVTPDGRRIVSGSSDYTIRIWDLETGAPIGGPIEEHFGIVNAIAVTPDGERFVSGSWDKTIRVWDLEIGAPIGSPIEGHKRSVNAVAVTPDGKHIVSGSNDGTICVWDLETGALIGSPIEGHEASVNAVAVTPDGKHIVSGSYDHTIRVWDLKTGAPIGEPIEGHEYSVNTVAVTPDGKRIVSGSRDGTICTTDIETRKVKTIKIHPLSFVGLDFSLADISDDELKETLRQNGAKV